MISIANQKNAPYTKTLSNGEGFTLLSYEERKIEEGLLTEEMRYDAETGIILLVEVAPEKTSQKSKSKEE